MDLKSFYKKHLNTIDTLLPYYLKSLEILIQHYTVPVALGKSIYDAPDIFKDGLQDMINEINSGDDTINPYMNFAKKYNFDIDVTQKVKKLTVSAKQKVEILKTLYRNAEVIILDEPTAVLTPQEIDELMQIMKNLANEGKSILFISHKFN